MNKAITHLAATILLSLSLIGISFADQPKENNPALKVIGSWWLNGSDKNTRFVFTKNGTFSYAGWGATSKGKWSVSGDKLTLVWTEIDKQKVQAGKVKGSYSLVDGELTILKYKYKRVKK